MRTLKNSLKIRTGYDRGRSFRDFLPKSVLFSVSDWLSFAVVPVNEKSDLNYCFSCNHCYFDTF